MKNYLLAIFIFSVLSMYAQSNVHSPYWNQKTDMYRILPNTEGEIIFLGDSITDRCEWAELFQNVNVKNRGLSGDRTSGLLDRLDEVIESKPDKIFVMIGVNDLRHDVPLYTIVGNYRNLVKRILLGSPGTRVIVQSVLPVNNIIGKPKTTCEKVLKLNEEISKIAADFGLVYIDLNKSFVDEKGMLDNKYSEDGLHINGEGYLLWASLIEEYVKNQ